ncbi:hypothetical protein D3C85_1625970 [compost metagenome]
MQLVEQPCADEWGEQQSCCAESQKHPEPVLNRRIGPQGELPLHIVQQSSHSTAACVLIRVAQQYGNNGAFDKLVHEVTPEKPVDK